MTENLDSIVISLSEAELALISKTAKELYEHDEGLLSEAETIERLSWIVFKLNESAQARDIFWNSQIEVKSHFVKDFFYIGPKVRNLFLLALHNSSLTTVPMVDRTFYGSDSFYTYASERLSEVPTFDENFKRIAARLSAHSKSQDWKSGLGNNSSYENMTVINTAIYLMRLYVSEETMIEIADRIIDEKAQIPIDAIYPLMTDWENWREYPLSWSFQIVSENPKLSI